MGIGAGIFLIAIGAILTFAVHASLNGLDLAVVGVILMIAGALGIVLDLIILAPRRRTVTYGTTAAAPVTRTVRTDDEVY